MAQAVEFKYAPMFQLGKDDTEYYLLTKDYVSEGEFEGHKILKVQPEALTLLAKQAFHDTNFMLRRAHNEQVAKILKDPEATDNDKYVALSFLRNAEVAAKGELPFCQDTGTAIIHGEKGQAVWTGFCDEEALSYAGTGVDVYAALAVYEFRHHARDERYSLSEKVMRHPVYGKGSEGRVADDHLGQRTCRRIPVKACLGVLLEQCPYLSQLPHQGVNDFISPPVHQIIRLSAVHFVALECVVDSLVQQGHEVFHLEDDCRLQAVFRAGEASSRIQEIEQAVFQCLYLGHCGQTGQALEDSVRVAEP